MARILVVDDLPDNVTLLTFDLEDRGYEVVGVYSGREAIEAATEQPPDAVLLDIMMPGMSGIEVCHRFKDDPRLASIPIILVTAKGQDQDIIDGLDAGADDYVPKPFNSRVLIARLETALRTKQAQDALRQANDQLAESNRQLDEKSKRLAELNEAAYQFVDNVSHEVRTPLSVIKEFASIIDDGLAGEVNPEQKEYLGIISASVDDLALMVRDMLDISKLEAGHLTVHRTSCAVDDVVHHVRTAIERKAATRHIDLAFDLPDDLPAAYADAPKVGRVLVNLAINAIKYAGENGQVKIWARADHEAGEIELGVTDNGAGIDPGRLEIIFERFQQVGVNARATTQGVGLGLNIAKELVTLNLGQMRVQSERGKGSTFSFTLPMAEPARLVDRYLDRPELARHGLAEVSLARAEIQEDCPHAAAREMDELLSDVLRSSDLVLWVAPRTWLLLLERSGPESQAVVKRIEECRQEANRNRPDGKLPPIAVSCVGTWDMATQRNVLANQLHETLRSIEAVHA
ncbi:MAG: hybrid sensor histidine kinase/response regulator [Pirellulales bacterium]|nr:hybrid sensor histidine kinase/response regulator [Pirellulales bacterium]